MITHPYKRRSAIIRWSEAILLGLLDLTGEVAYLMLSTPYKGFALLPRRSGYYQTCRQLQRAGYIRHTTSKRSPYCLTAKGKTKAISLQLKSMRPHRLAWDGKWRIVIFDVSERRRTGRDLLRRQLKLLGFIQLQSSVWVSPFDPPPLLRNLLKESQLLTSSRLMTVEKMDYDKDLRRQFGLLKTVGRR